MRSERPPLDPEERALLDAVIDAPDDDGPRLVYADWLMLRTEAWQRARGELIVVQCTAERAPDVTEHNRVKVRDFELIERFGHLWCAHAGLGGVQDAWSESLWQADFQRGFIDTVVMRTSQLPGVIVRLLSLEPVRAIHLNGPDPTVIPRLGEMVHLRRLRGLALVRTQITTDQLVQLARSPHAVNLERIEIHGDSIALSALEAIAKLPRLKELAFRDAGIGSPAHVAVIAGLALERLEIQGFLGDESLSLLAAGPRLANLRELVLVGVGGLDVRRRIETRFGKHVVRWV